MPPRPASIKVRALQWLAQREHSPQELRDKLLRLPAPPTPADPVAEVDTLLQWLEQRGYLSQQRFIESRVNARQARFGNLHIRHELQQHGLSLDREAQQRLQNTELQRAQEIWRKKYKVHATDAAGRARQMRFMIGRGFAIDVARRVVFEAQRFEGDSDNAGGPD